MTKKVQIHLISDSTGETVSSIARSVMSQFDGVDPEENIWALIRTKGQVEKVMQTVKENPGLVMYTVIDKELQEMIREECKKLNVPCINPLSRVITYFSTWLDIEAKGRPGTQYELDEEYFERVDAINFSLAHDDGQGTWDLNEADVVLVGPSRTSKSPTCIYLSYRGLKAANVPMVKDIPLPENLFELKKPLIVGLVIEPERLMQIRKSRMQSMNENRDTNYVDTDYIKDELSEARKLFNKMKWPTIDVTRKSVEETAANIMQLYQQKKKKEKA